MAVKHRYWDTWAEYRYGVPTKKRRRQPKLPKISILSERESILEPAEAKRLVKLTAQIADDYRASPWEHEASLRHGLTVGFLDRTTSWDRADDEAARIVHKAYVSLKRGPERRPSLLEGQKEFTRPVEQCQRCGRDLDDDDISSRKSF